MASVENSVGDPAVGVLPVSAQAQTGTQLDEPAHPDTDGVVPQHSLPQNWSRTRRWLIVLALSLTSLMVSMSLVICAPSSTAIAQEFQSHNSLLLVFYITAPNLGQIFSSLYISPLSERFGRVHVYHLFNLLFLVLTLGTGFSTSLNMLIVLRALTGATIAPICLNPAITGDLFAVKKRGSAMSAASLIPIMGSAVGPIVGGYITQYWGWRWTFWVMAILSASVQPFLAVVLRETYLPVIRRKALKKAGVCPGESEKRSKHLQGFNWGTVRALFLLAVRPFLILGSIRVAVIATLYLSMLYGYLGLLAANMATVFQDVYGFSESESGLIYLATTAGTMGGAVYCIFTLDYFSKVGLSRIKRDAEWSHSPGDRLLPIVPAMVAFPAGLLLYGWSLQRRWHWIVPTLSTTLCGFSLASSTTPIMTYLVDIFGDRSASAIAALLPLRYIVGTFLPVASPYMDSKLGYGWSYSLLALLLLIPIPPTFVMIIWPRDTKATMTVEQ